MQISGPYTSEYVHVNSCHHHRHRRFLKRQEEEELEYIVQTFEGLESDQVWKEEMVDGVLKEPLLS